MKKSGKANDPAEMGQNPNSNSILEDYFLRSLQEMYYAENEISVAFGNIKDQIISVDLQDILQIHYAIHLKHIERLEKIFRLRNETIVNNNCEVLNSLLSEGVNHLSFFSDDNVNWEVALILVSQKLAHYKIASYGGLAHLAIKLNFHAAAAFLAFSVQEEEEFITNYLNGLIDAFFAAHVEGYKS